MQRHLVGIVTAALAAAACATQHPPDRRAGPGSAGGALLQSGGFFFVAADANGDYAVDMQELNQAIDAAYASANADRDDNISALEYANWAERALGARDARPGRFVVDPNGDGAITPGEFRNAFMDLASQYGLTEGHPLTFASLVEIMPSGGFDRGEPGERRPPGGPGGGRGPRGG